MVAEPVVTTIAPPPMGKDYTLHTVQANGLQFSVGCWLGGPTQVVAVHGLTANHRCWQHIAAALQLQGCTLWAIDLRGRGRSDKPLLGPYGTATHASDVVAVMDALGLTNVVLMGHSLGAMVALKVAAANPQQIAKLILLDAGGEINLGQASRVLLALRPSLMRLGRIYLNEEQYLQEAQMSTVSGGLTPAMEDFYRYELEPAPLGGVRCNIPPLVIEQEFLALGGALASWTMVHSTYHRRKHSTTQNNQRPPYQYIKAPTLLLKAADYTVVPDDHILPLYAYHRLLAELPLADGYILPHTNHYSIAFAGNAERDNLLKDFIKQ